MKKQHVVWPLLLFCLLANAQKKKPLTGRMDYDRINQAMLMTDIIIDNYSFSFLKLPDTTLGRVYESYTGYSAERKEQYDSFSHDVSYVNGMLDNCKDACEFHRPGDIYITELKTGISHLKERFPLFDVSGYEKAFDFCLWVKERHLRIQDSLQEVAAKEREKESARQDSIRHSLEILAEIHERQQDSLRHIEKMRADSLDQARIKKDKIAYRKECIRLFGPKNGNIIANGEIKLGFTDEMVDYAWGGDLYTTYTIYTKSGNLEKRVYNTGKILTFKKGVLISITE